MCSQNQTKTLKAHTHRQIQMIGRTLTNKLHKIAEYQKLDSVVYHSVYGHAFIRIFYTNIKAYCNRLIRVITIIYTIYSNTYNYYLAYYKASRHVVYTAQQYFLVNGYFMDTHTPEEKLRIVYCCMCFLCGVEENRNGEQQSEEEGRRQRGK